MSRTLPNKCVMVRAQSDGNSRAIRMISFFHETPDGTPEDIWTLFRMGEDVFVVDKVTLSVMAECECELLTRDSDKDSSEPSIVAVSLRDRESYDMSIVDIKKVQNDVLSD